MSEDTGIRATSKRTGWLLVAAGLLMNQWSVGYFLAADGKIDDLFFIAIVWVADLTLIWLGVNRLRAREPLSRREIAFRSILLVSTILVIELVLNTIRVAVEALADPIDTRASLSPFREEEWARRFFAEVADYTDGSWRYHPHLGWDALPFRGEFIDVDSVGVRKTWLPEPAPGDDVPTIYMFGGSTTWGMLARDEYTVPSYLQKKLHEAGRSFRVFNYGDLAYTSTQELINLILLLRDGHRPDFVIFYDGVNDTYGAHQAGSAGNVLNVFGSKEKFDERLTPRRHLGIAFQGLLADYSVLYSFAVRARNLINPPPVYPEPGARFSDQQLRNLGEDIATNYAKTIEFLDRLSKAYEFEFLAFWQPVTFTEDHLFAEEEIDIRVGDKALGKLHRFVVEALHRKRIANFHDISGVLKGRTTTQYVDYCHLSEDGNRVVANAIADIFLASLERASEGPTGPRGVDGDRAMR